MGNQFRTKRTKWHTVFTTKLKYHINQFLQFFQALIHIWREAAWEKKLPVTDLCGKEACIGWLIAHGHSQCAEDRLEQNNDI